VKGTERNGLYADGGQCAITKLLYLIGRDECKTDGPVFQSVLRLATSSKFRGLSPGGDEIFYTCPDPPWGPPKLLYNGTGSFLVVKSGQGVMLTPQSLLEPLVMKVYSYTSTPLWVVRPVQSLSACTRVTFTFTFYVKGVNVDENKNHQ